MFTLKIQGKYGLEPTRREDIVFVAVFQHEYQPSVKPNKCNVGKLTQHG